jgi:hypothetical protein
MSTSLQIAQPAKTAKRTLALSEEHWALFDEYVQAANSEQTGISDAMVLTAILLNQISKDRVFQQWKRRMTEKTTSKEA